ncbi:MAG TPA: translocation/assembly module TamB domain-containing protein [Candidatus Acidoferrales bacterium]|nr:translocation/assembly module TamB domain-containing protein [Candidatus Acidoferrales bacterium]
MRNRIVLAAASLLAVVGLAVAGRQAIARAAIELGVASLAHVRLAIDSSDVTLDRATLSGITVTSWSGEPIARIAELSLDYDVRDLLPGGTRRYGLRAIDVERPQIFIVRHADGTYNVPIPRLPARSSAPSAPAIFSLRVTDGSVQVVNGAERDASRRNLYARRIEATMDLDTAAASHYRVTIAYGQSPSQLFAIRGTGDVAPSFAMQHWTAQQIPVAGAIDFALNGSGAELSRGTLRGVDARIYGMPAAGGGLESHLTATAYLDDAAATVAGLNAPIEDVHGRLDVYDDGLTTRRLDAAIAGIPAVVTGGIYDLHAPQFRLAVRGGGDLRRLRNAFVQAKRLPVEGPISFALLVEGSVSRPLAWISFASPNGRFRSQTFRSTSGLVAFDDREADAVGIRSNLDGIETGIVGRAPLSPGKNPIELLVTADGSDGRVPYAPLAIGPMHLHATVLASATHPDAFGLQGSIEGDGPGRALDGIVDVAAAGRGTVGPLLLRDGRGSLYARLVLDRPDGTIAGIADARRFALPMGSGNLDADVAAVEEGGTSRGLAGATLRGRWGEFRAGGVFTPRDAAFSGRLTASLAQARAFGLAGARGTVDAPIALAYSNGRGVIALHGVRFAGASIAGIPIRALNATIEASRRELRVAAADARVGGGRAIAAGSTARGGAIGISARDVRAAQLGGLTSLGATIAGSISRPQIAGTFLIDGAHVGRYALAALGIVGLSSQRLSASADARVGPAFASANGTLGRLQGARFSPNYDLDASLSTSDLGSLVAFAPAGAPVLVRTIQGSLDARGRLYGDRMLPAFDGTLDAPEGSVNGLAFSNLRANVNATGGDLAVTRGDVTVGSTALAFDATANPASEGVALDAPRADLADFDDFFDAGDVLEGTGAFAMTASLAGARVLAASGSANFANARYRNLALGSVDARWRGTQRAIATTLSFGGASGTVRLEGTVAPAGRAIDLQASASDLDLAVWLPMLGVRAPVTGKLDARAALSGRYPALDSSVTASLRDGTAFRLPIERFVFAESGTDGRATIRSAVAEVPYLTATASGSFGFSPRDAIAIAVRANSPDVGKLLSQATGKPWSFAGTLDSTLDVAGSALQPSFTDTFALQSLRLAGLTVPRVAGTLGGNRTLVALRGGEIDLQPGRVLLDAVLPLQGRGAVRASATLQHVGLANAAPLFAKGTHIAGNVDGRVTVGGTTGRPQFGGMLELTDGSFSGPQERAPIADLTATLALSGTRASLQSLRALVGGGEVAATGWASVASLRSIDGVSFALKATAANAHLAVPGYFTGNLDAAISLARAGAAAPVTLGGDVAVANAIVPLGAIYNPGAAGKKPPALPPIAFDGFRVTAGPNVRVQGNSVDVGGTGSLVIDGSLSRPVLAGVFHTTGGSLDFYRNFTLQRGSVSFDRNGGLTPYVDVVATTFLTSPPTDVRLHVTGPATSMDLALSSDPPYDKSQILGLLVGAQQFGAVRGVASSGASGAFSLPGSARNLALGQLNGAFTRQMLEPLSTSLGGALGFTNLQITNDLQSGLGINAVKAFGKNVDAIAGETFGYPQTQSLTLEVHPNVAESLRLRLYSSEGPTLFALQGTQIQPVAANVLDLNPMTSEPILGGTNGLDFSYVRRFP